MKTKAGSNSIPCPEDMDFGNEDFTLSWKGRTHIKTAEEKEITTPLKYTPPNVQLFQDHNLYELWWEDRTEYRGLSSWVGKGTWGYGVSKNSSHLISNKDIVFIFKQYEDAKKFMDDHEWVKYIIGGWVDVQECPSI